MIAQADVLRESDITRLTVIPKYRLYVDNKLFAERVFPHGDVEIEESVYLNLKPGRHELKVESVSKQQISIKNIHINDQFIDVYSDKCSFNIS